VLPGAPAEQHVPRPGHGRGHLAAHHLVGVPRAPAAVREAAAGVLIRAAQALHDAVEGDPHRDRDGTHRPAPFVPGPPPRGPVTPYTNDGRRDRHPPRGTEATLRLVRSSPKPNGLRV